MKKKETLSSTKTKEPKKSIKKTTKKKEVKTKLEIPKEWIGTSSKSRPKTKDVSSNTTKFSGKIKESIFEEVDEQTFQVERKKQREKIKK